MQDYHAVETKLGGIGLVELIVPVGHVDHARERWHGSERFRTRSRRFR